MAEAKISLQKLMEARVHLGHPRGRWDPRMKPFVYGRQSGIYVIDLVLTRKCLLEAREFLGKVSKEGKKILMVGTKKQAQESVKKWAQKTKSAYLVERWPGGMLTNFGEVQKGLEKLRGLKELKKSDEWESLSTRRQCAVTREIERAEKIFGGVVDLTEMPGALLVVDARRERAAVKEAAKMSVPVVGIIDTDGNPEEIDYPIPANDDSSRSIGLVVELAVGEMLGGRAAGSGSKDSKGKKSASDRKIAGARVESKTVEQSDLPARAKKALIKSGYTKLSQVKELSADELTQIEGIGQKTAEEIAKS